jgi:ubiquinone/menaquinone biosynthesis C-methylase UbiE
MTADFVDEHSARAARTYGAAADHFLRPALGFWDRFGAATIDRLQLSPGYAVLDLCCGAGASAIPAARAVGLSGRVLGIDVAAPLLEAARARAAPERLANVEFRRADARHTNLPTRSFDAVICVFGVFFAADMEAFTAEMWRLVRPGGCLAITTWGPGLFDPAGEHFWNAVADLAPALYKGFNPWDEITTPAALAGLLKRSGIDESEVEAVAGEHPLNAPEDFWHIVLGSGYRATVDALTPDQRRVLHSTLLDRLREHAVLAVRTDVVYGRARRRHH